MRPKRVYQKMKEMRRKKFELLALQKERKKDVSTPSVDITLEPSDSSEDCNPHIGVPSQLTENNEELQSLLSLSSSCKEDLIRVLSTAIQFQRHSHQLKLRSSHFRKALALHDFSLESDDSDDFQDLNNSESAYDNISEETEKQQFLCHGRWLSHS